MADGIVHLAPASSNGQATYCVNDGGRGQNCKASIEAHGGTTLHRREDWRRWKQTIQIHTEKIGVYLQFAICGKRKDSMCLRFQTCRFPSL